MISYVISVGHFFEKQSKKNFTTFQQISFSDVVKCLELSLKLYSDNENIRIYEKNNNINQLIFQHRNCFKSDQDNFG